MNGTCYKRMSRRLSINKSLVIRRHGQLCAALFGGILFLLCSNCAASVGKNDANAAVNRSRRLALNYSALRSSAARMVRERNGLGRDAIVAVEPEPVKKHGKFIVFRVHEQLGTQSSTDDVILSSDNRLYSQGIVGELSRVSPEEIVRAYRALQPHSTLRSMAATTPHKSASVGLTEGMLYGLEKATVTNIPYTVDWSQRAIVFGMMIRVLSEDEQARIGSSGASITFGSLSPKRVLVVYSDLECPYCKALEDKLPILQLTTEYTDLQIVLRNYPLPYHKWAFGAAKTGVCVYKQSPQAYIAFRSAVYAVQGALADSDAQVKVDEIAASQSGIDPATLTRCENDPATDRSIALDEESGAKLQLSGIPAVYLNGHLLLDIPDVQEFGRQEYIGVQNSACSEKATSCTVP